MEVRSVNSTALSLIHYRINVNPEILDIQKIIDISLEHFKIKYDNGDSNKTLSDINKSIDIMSPEEQKKRVEEET